MLNLQDVDFTKMSLAEIIEKLRSYEKPGLAPLIQYVANGHSYLHGVMAAREAFAHADREAQKWGKFSR